MEFGIHRRLLDRESFSRRNIGRLLLILLIIACVGGIGFLLFELRSETQLRTSAESTVAELQSQVATLTAQLVTQKGEAQLAVEAAEKGQEDRVGAFAKQAAPAIIDTPDAKIIVLRPIDQWTQDSSAMNNALSGYKDKEYKFMLKDASGKTEFLRTNIFSSSVEGKSPAMMAAYQAAEAQGWKTSMNPGFGFIVDKPVLVSGEQAEKALSVQKEAYTAFVETVGNPDDLQTSYTIKKLLGGAITIGITAFATDKLGGMFASNAVLGSGIATDIGSIPTALAKEMPFIYPPQGLPLKAYKTVEFRRVQGLNTGYGQVLIAYKTEKTAEAAETALAKAIESLIGLDTNQQQIQSARLEDFNRRKTIWNECVASGKCTTEPVSTNNQESR